MTRPMLLSDCMRRDIKVLAPDLEMLQAMELLLSHDISGAPVVGENGDLVGVLSLKDCLRAAVQASYYGDWAGPVSRFMTRDVVSLDADTELLAAAETFLASGYRRFPVLRAGRLVGQVSRSDLLRALCDLRAGSTDNPPEPQEP